MINWVIEASPHGEDESRCQAPPEIFARLTALRYKNIKIRHQLEVDAVKLFLTRVEI